MGWDRQSVIERAAVSAATAWGFYLMARFVNHRWRMSALEQQLQETAESLERERTKRKADRVGRIRAEQELRAARMRLQELQLQLGQQQQQRPEGSQEQEQEAAAAREAAARVSSGGEGEAEEGEEEGGVEFEDGEVEAADAADLKAAAAAGAAQLAAAGSSISVFPFRPIGHLRSVFTERNGTPRQPQLVPAARSRLVLCPNIPAACLEGLTQYSHCWVLYVFHANTDLAKYLSADRTGLKAKVHVPRLNGGRMGVLATRSPHRPSPIGLSTARVLAVEGNTLLLGGADIVDGSPVLDIKPYVPFCDSPAGATAPTWVQAEAEDEPLALSQVVVEEGPRAALERAWAARRQHSMYGSGEEYLQLVTQVLSRDIRSLHHRLNLYPVGKAAEGASDTNGSSSKRKGGSSKYQAGPPAPHEAALRTFALSAAAAGGAASGEGANGTATSSAAAGSTDPAAAGASGPGAYHVVLENIYVSYDITPDGVVVLRDAWVDPVTAKSAPLPST